jgi:hypothetical protein
MHKHTILLAACVAALALTTASIHAFPTARYNDLTFNRPVALPGVTLAAGQYRFELIDSAGVVRVSNPRTYQVYFMRHTLPVHRPHRLPSGQRVTFGEAPEGDAPPIRVWFPADSGDGRQFVY